MKMIVFMVVGVIILAIFGYFVLTDKLTPSFQQKTLGVTTQAPASEEKLKVEDIKVGTGSAVKSGDAIEINYVGKLTNGTIFSQTEDGKPFETPIGTGQLIKGWDVGIIGMRVGGKRKITIPPSMGYGDQQVGSIPPNSTLIFEVELVGIK